MNWKHSLKVFALIGFIFPLASQAATQGDLMGCHTRPLSDFLDAQGSTIEFYPPVQDMLAWTDAEFVTFALVDYAGLADKYIQQVTGKSLGTRMHGRVLECPTDDGRAKISVVLNTSKALGFAQSLDDLFATYDPDCDCLDFLNTATIFGVKAQDVANAPPNNGVTPALGPASFHMTFYIDFPGADLPDIRPAFQANVPDVRPITLDFRSTTVGLLPDGTKARLSIQQVGATDPLGELVFTREIVDLNK